MGTMGAMGSLKKVSGWAIAWSILLILAGIAMTFLPFFAGVGIAAVVGWLLVISGIFHLIEAFQTKSAGPFLWQILVGILYVIGGFNIAMHPAWGLVIMTLVLGIMLIVEGLIGIFGFFSHRKLPGARWILFNAICALVLGAIIWREGPVSAVWVIGTLVGINLIFSGFARLMLWSAVRGVLRTQPKQA